MSPNNAGVAQITLVLAVPFIPISIGVAVLRYRLYDIDTLINRALVYGTLTAILAGLYTAGIGVFQRLFGAIAGEHSESGIVLVTLLVAAAFTPLRARLQQAVDRRFKPALGERPREIAASPGAELALVRSEIASLRAELRGHIDRARGSK